MSVVKKIIVLCGGVSPEREVSLNSGREVQRALTEAGFEAVRADIQALADTELLVRDFDAVFIALHGGWGEDGTIQAELERLGIPYTGSGSEACAIAMNKTRALERFVNAGLKIPQGVSITSEQTPDFTAVCAQLGHDLVVKPRNGGSTVGVTILHDANEPDFLKAIKAARDSYNSELEQDAKETVLVEKYIAGRELTVTVLERGGEVTALPVIEIAPHTGYYDYTNKYTKGATDYLVPAPLPEEIASQVQEAAITAHKCLGCRTYSRADFRLTPDGTPYILEVNTVPGMTGTSLVPKAARAVGISFPELVTMLLTYFPD